LEVGFFLLLCPSGSFKEPPFLPERNGKYSTKKKRDSPGGDSTMGLSAALDLAVEVEKSGRPSSPPPPLARKGTKAAAGAGAASSSSFDVEEGGREGGGAASSAAAASAAAGSSSLAVGRSSSFCSGTGTGGGGGAAASPSSGAVAAVVAAASSVSAPGAVVALGRSSSAGSFASTAATTAAAASALARALAAGPGRAFFWSGGEEAASAAVASSSAASPAAAPAPAPARFRAPAEEEGAASGAAAAAASGAIVVVVFAAAEGSGCVRLRLRWWEEEVESRRAEKKAKREFFFPVRGRKENRIAIQGPQSPRKPRVQFPKEALDDGGERSAKGELREERILAAGVGREEETKKGKRQRQERGAPREKLGGVAPHLPLMPRIVSAPSPLVEALSAPDYFSNQKKKPLSTRPHDRKTARGRGRGREGPAGNEGGGTKSKERKQWWQLLPSPPFTDLFLATHRFSSSFLTGPQRGALALCRRVGKREKERVRETKNRKRRNGRLPRLESPL
jgi:hypothetical protein